MPSLFDSVAVGAIAAPNRIFMAPLTRGRSTREHVPTPLMAEYYAQRASAGLIITEATGVSQQGLGWAYAPGIWNDTQETAWRVITQGVHRAGGRIVCQLWHMGRLVHPSFLNGGAPISASATMAPGHAHTYDGDQPYATARALDVSEIPALLEDYRRAARNALAAGFDGVQIHAANGYLIDQFLRDNSNFRHDEYGGPIVNRIRLLREVTAAVIEVAGAARTGVRLSPNGAVQGVNDSDPEPLFTAAAAALDELGIAFLELREPPPGASPGGPDHPPIAPSVRRVFGNTLVLNAGYDAERGQAALDAGAADAIAYGRPFIANPDLPRRFADRLALTPPNPPTFYTQGPQGYTDYPVAI